MRFWPSWRFEVRPEPVEQGRFLIALVLPLLLAALIAAGVRPRPSPAPRWTGALVVAVQAAGVAFVAVCYLQQRQQILGPLYPPAALTPILYSFFSPATLLVAAAGTAAVALAAASARMRSGWAHLALRETRVRALAGFALAAAAIAVWLLHAAYTERTIAAAPREVWFHLQFTMDETFAVLDGRSPLVNFAAQYGSLWPYAFAAGMRLLGTSAGVWVTLALVATGLGMLAVYALLRRVAGSSIAGLALFLPVLAASFFKIEGTIESRYTYGSYFGTFPMRYAGPSILAWLVARHLAGVRPRRTWPLFLAAGLVVLNNADMGLAALGATVAAVLWGERGLTRARLGRLALDAAGGLAAAYALVAALTLARAGALPDLGVLLRYSRLFAIAGYGMYPMPAIGLHLAIYLTYVAALGVATVGARRADGRLLSGMLAWAAVFGLGAGAYFAGRSTPDDLPAMFFPWSLALALLLIPAVRALAASSWRRPQVAAAACVFGFLVMACTLAQTPTPWEQLERLSRAAAPVFAAPPGQAFVASRTRRGERVAILLSLGHRIGANVGVVNVSPYSNSISMPSVEQLDETVAALRAAGGRQVFLDMTSASTEMQRALEGDGFAFAGEDAGGQTGVWVDRAASARVR